MPLLGRVPLDENVVAGGDNGEPVVRARPESKAALELRAAAALLTKLLPPAEDDTCTSRIAILAEQLAELG